MRAHTRSSVLGRPWRSRPSSTPRASPGIARPGHGHRSASLATVTAPWRACRAVAVISSHVLVELRGRARGRRAPPGPAPALRVGITATAAPARRGRPRRCGPPPAADCRVGSSLGSTTTSSRAGGGDRLEQLAGRSGAGAGRRAIDDRAGLLGQGAARPGPAATATTRRPACRGCAGASWCAAWRAICSAKWVTRIRCGPPERRAPASMAAPTSSAWTCTFQRPSPPTTTSGVAERAGAARGGPGSRRRPGRRGGTSPRRRGRPRTASAPVGRARAAGTGIAWLPSGVGDRDSAGARSGRSRQASRSTREPAAAGVDDARLRRGRAAAPGVRPSAARAAAGGDSARTSRVRAASPASRRAPPAASAAARSTREHGALLAGSPTAAYAGVADAWRSASAMTVGGALSSVSLRARCGAAVAPSISAQDHPGVAAGAQQRAARAAP